MKTMCLHFMKACSMAVGMIVMGMLSPQAVKAQGNAQTFTQEQLKEYFNNRPKPDKWMDPTGKYPVVMEGPNVRRSHHLSSC